MDSAIRWLRISYWVGAITDLVAAVQMLSPPVFRFGMALPDFAPGTDFRFAMGMGAALMLGWTALLLWADRDPVARMGVLPLTVFPVVFGLAVNQGYGVWAGFLPMAAVLPIWVLQIGLTVLFLGSYTRARTALRSHGGGAAAGA